MFSYTKCIKIKIKQMIFSQFREHHFNQYTNFPSKPDFLPVSCRKSAVFLLDCIPIIGYNRSDARTGISTEKYII